MKKSIIVFLFLPFLLGSCDPNGQSIKTPTEEQDKQQDNDESAEEKQQQDIQHEKEYTGENEENHQQNSNILLDEWKDYEFHDGHKPAWNDEWDFYYGDTNKPLNSCFYECPNEALDYSGIKFYDKKEYLVSPNFSSCPKVEVKFQFWMSAKTGSKYKAVANEPQFKIEEFDSTNRLINTDNLFIEKSDVHTDNTPTEMKLDITQSKMTSFIVRFNNFVPNGNSGYMPVLCKISLKGIQNI